MHRKFKVVGTGLALILILVGCNAKKSEGEDPSALENKVQEQLAKAQYMNGEMQNFVVTASVGEINEQAMVTGTLKQDRSGEIPVTSMQGQVDVAGMKVDVDYYADSEMIVTTVGGDMGKADLTDEQKEQLKSSKENQAASMTDIKKIVTLSEENNKRLLTVVVDKDAAADYFGLQPIGFFMDVAGLFVDSSNAEFEALEVNYLLRDDDTVEEIRYQLAVGIGEDGDGMTITGTLKIDNFDEVEISKPDLSKAES